MKVLVSMRLGFTLGGGLKRGPGGVSPDQHRCAAVANPSLAVRALSATVRATAVGDRRCRRRKHGAC